MNCPATSAPRMGLGGNQVVLAGRDRILYCAVHMRRLVYHCFLA